jgi:hypothetical protein
MKEGAASSDVPRYERPIRRKRRNESVYRKRRTRLAVGMIVLCLAVVAVVLAVTAGGSSAQGSAEGLTTGPSALAAVTADPGTPHPAFARLGDRNLLLPVSADDVTIIAYQPVTDAQALQFDPIGEQTNSNALVRFVRGIVSGQPAVRYYLLPGEGSGSTGAILVGAVAGSPVTAPVSGTVIAVKQYSLFGKYDDVEVDIRPEDTSGTTLTLLLVDDPVVTMGETVTAGKTALGTVREVPEELGKQLSVYTHDKGAHLIIQATKEPVS